YARHSETPAAPPPPEGLGRIERAIAATRIRDNQRFLLVGALTLVVLLLLFGLVSRDPGAPAPAAIPTIEPTPIADSTIDAVLVARRAVEVTVTIDGAVETHAMEEGETRSFSANEELVLSAPDGGAVEVSVGDSELVVAGERGVRWTETLTPGEIQVPITASPAP
ncbi:MAG: hypothetical protein WD186_05580, partial [Actinomycetota bacterium]